MERTRRKSSASEFFSRRHSSSLFQSMRRYSSSTIFGPRQGSASGDTGDTKNNGVTEKRKGRRHSSTQLPISDSETGAAHHEKLRPLTNALGDVDELQEGDGENGDGRESGSGTCHTVVVANCTFEMLVGACDCANSSEGEIFS